MARAPFGKPPPFCLSPTGKKTPPRRGNASRFENQNGASQKKRQRQRGKRPFGASLPLRAPTALRNPLRDGQARPLRRDFGTDGAINCTGNIGKKSYRAKYFAFRRGARLRCIASGYVNRSCDDASTQKTSAL